MRTLIALLLFLPLLPTVQVATPDAPDRWRPQPGQIFDIRLQQPDGVLDPSVNVLELDVHDAEASVVQQLEREGIRTICYFSVGTWEEWRPDAGQFPEHVIGEAWDEWPGERYLDTRQLDLLLPVFEKRLDLCAAKGFSGVDPDNIDSWWSETGFPLTMDDNLQLIDHLITAAHERGLAIGQKNTPEIALDRASRFDFAVVEDCAADDWCDQMQPFVQAGKPVYAIEYTDATSQSAFASYCDRSDLEGYALVLKHRDLDAYSRHCVEHGRRT